MRNTRVIIHAAHLRHNISRTLELAGGLPACLAVKANAYGHGAVSCARTALASGIGMLGVSCAAEARELRDAGIDGRIIIYAPPFPEEAADMVRLGVECFCPDLRSLEMMDSAGRETGTRARVHLKVDTGMGRLGCTPAEAPELAAWAAGPDRMVELAGLCTHFPLSDADRDGFTANQTRAFLDLADGIRSRGIALPLVHASNSGGILNFGCKGFDMVRPGIMAWGYPGPGPCGEGAEQGFLPVMEVRSRISFVKEVAPGTGISYGLRWTAPGPRWIGTVAIGYADGLPRRCSSALRFTASAGRVFDQAGTICMDQCMIDLGPSRGPGGKPLPCPARAGEELTIFGPAPAVMSARDVADRAGTIPYEILCGINGRIPREVLP